MTIFPNRDISSATLEDLKIIESQIGKNGVESFLRDEFDPYLRNFFKDHGLDIVENISLNYDPEGEILDIENGQTAIGMPSDFEGIGGLVYVGRKPENTSANTDFLLNSIIGEEYLHAHYPQKVDSEQFGWHRLDQNAVDVIGNILEFYCEDRIYDHQKRENRLSDFRRDYNLAVAETTGELLEDFDNLKKGNSLYADNEKDLMSYILANPEPVFREYNKRRQNL